MGITVTRRGQQLTFSGERIAKTIAGLVPGMILRRTEQGIDANGQQFAPYSKRHLQFLRRGGEDTKVDLRLSGGLLNSIKARNIEILKDAVRVIVAPDAGTSPVWKPKAGGKKRYARAQRKFKKLSDAGDYSTHVAGRQISRAYRMQRTGEQSPPHNIVGYWLHHGTPTMKARPFMGLTDEQWKTLRAAIAKVMWK